MFSCAQKTLVFSFYPVGKKHPREPEFFAPQGLTLAGVTYARAIALAMDLALRDPTPALLPHALHPLSIDDAVRSWVKSSTGRLRRSKKMVTR